MPASAREHGKHVPRLVWNAQDAAEILGMSVWALLDLRHKHPLYRPDVERSGLGRPGKEPKDPRPMWSDELLKLIAFAWRKTAQGERQYTDDEAYQLWLDMNEEERERYMARSGNAGKKAI